METLLLHGKDMTGQCRSPVDGAMAVLIMVRPLLLDHLQLPVMAVVVDAIVLLSLLLLLICVIVL